MKTAKSVTLRRYLLGMNHRNIKDQPVMVVEAGGKVSGIGKLFEE